MKNQDAGQSQSPRKAAPGRQRGGGEPAARQAAAQPQPGTPPLDLTVASLTDVGRSRQYQQDSVSYYIPQDPQQMAHKGAIYIVADGMGGHQAGDVASQGAVAHVISQYYADTHSDIGTCLVRAFRSANRLIYDQAQANPAYSGMGTTMVAAVILGRKVYVANTGDSRAYLVGPKAIRQITEDHSWVSEQVRAGLLTPEEARVHPQRNVVTRALGSKPVVEVDLFEGELGDADALFMCTDGVTGHLEDHEIAALLRAQPPREAARQIVAAANERGGHDNMGMIIVSGPKAVASARLTVASPVRPAAAPARQRRRPVALMGIAVAAVALVAVAVGGIFFLNNHGNGTGTSVAAVTTTETSPTVTLAPGTSTTPAVDTPTAEQALPIDTPTGATASETESAVTPAPTSTLAPFATTAPPPPTRNASNPVPTNTRRPVATATRTPRPPDYTPIKLTKPDDGDTLSGIVTFEWEGVPLQPDHLYDLRFWSKEELDRGDPGRGANPPSDATKQPVNLDNLHTIVEHGDGSAYYWGVVIVRPRGGKLDPEVIRPADEPRLFYHRPEKTPAPEPGGGTDTPPGPQPPAPTTGATPRP